MSEMVAPVHHEAAREARASFQVGDSPDILRMIARDEINLAVWSRAIEPRVAQALTAWTHACSPSFEALITEPRANFGRATAGLNPTARNCLEDDLERLLEYFWDLAECSSARITLGAVCNDRCRKFHVDCVTFRLVTTYVGPGIEWVPDHFVNRQWLSLPGDDPLQANLAIVAEPGAVRRARAGEVLVMKGALHPNRNGAVHRSPSLEHAHQARLLLTVSTTLD